MEQHTKPRCGSGRIYGTASARRVKHTLVTPRVSSSSTTSQISADCGPVHAAHPTENNNDALLVSRETTADKKPQDNNNDTLPVSRETTADQKPQLQPSSATQHLKTSADDHSPVSGDISAHRMTEDRLTALEDKTNRILDMLQQLLSTQPAGKDSTSENRLWERVQAMERKTDRVIGLLEQSDDLKNIQAECNCQTNMTCQCHRLQKACSAEDLQDATDGHLVVDRERGVLFCDVCVNARDIPGDSALEGVFRYDITTGSSETTLSQFAHLKADVTEHFISQKHARTLRNLVTDVKRKCDVCRELAELSFRGLQQAVWLLRSNTSHTQEVLAALALLRDAAGSTLGIVPSACQPPGDPGPGAARDTSAPAAASAGAAPLTPPSEDWSEPPAPTDAGTAPGPTGRTSSPAASSPPRQANERHSFRVAERPPRLPPSGEKETGQSTPQTDLPMPVTFRVNFGRKKTAGKSSRPSRLPWGVADARSRTARCGEVRQQRRGTPGPGDAPTAADSGATARPRPLKRKRHLVDSPAPAPRIPNTLTSRSSQWSVGDGIKDEVCDGIDAPWTVNGAGWQTKHQSPNTSPSPGETLDTIKRELDIFLSDVPPLKTEPPLP